MRSERQPPAPTTVACGTMSSSSTRWLSASAPVSCSRARFICDRPVSPRKPCARGINSPQLQPQRTVARGKAGRHRLEGAHLRTGEKKASFPSYSSGRTPHLPLTLLAAHGKGHSRLETGCVPSGGAQFVVALGKRPALDESRG